MSMDTTLHGRLTRRMAALKNERSGFESHWQDIARYQAPKRGRFHERQQGSDRGRKSHHKIINSAGLVASRTLAAGMMTGLTSPARPWFRLATPDHELSKSVRVRAWLDEVTKRMRDVLLRSNFYNVLPSMYRELGDFATSPIAMLEDNEDVVRFYHFTVGSYYIAQDDRLQVNTFARPFEYTVGQVAGRYGEKAMSRPLRQKFNLGKVDEKVRLIQLIQPNELYQPGKVDADGMMFRSVVVEEGCQERDRYLENTGFNEFPILAARWETMDDTPYGVSCPGMDALGDIRQLQYTEIKSAEVLDKINNPPLQAPEGVRDRISMLPGRVTYKPPTQQGQLSVEPIHVPDVRAYQFTRDAASVLERRINTAYFADLFLMLHMAPDVDRTATEIAERKEEKLLVLGPVLEQLNSDTFDPLVDRLFGIMLRRGMIPAAPPELEGVDLKVEYTSILAQSLKVVATGSIERFASFAGNLAGIKPEVLDRIDGDQMLDEYGEALGVPARVMASDEQVAAVRRQRAQQQQMQQMAQMAGPMDQAAGAMQKLAGTTPEPGNLVEQLMAAGGGEGPAA